MIPAQGTAGESCFCAVGNGAERFPVHKHRLHHRGVWSKCTRRGWNRPWEPESIRALESARGWGIE